MTPVQSESYGFDFQQMLMDYLDFLLDMAV
jgi:hypothetical protein